MSVQLRPIQPADYDTVLSWNHDHVELLAPLDQALLEDLLDLADVGAMIEHEGTPAGFVLTFTAGTAYESENYRWFADRHADFLYLDRVVVDPALRRSGVASALYDLIEARAAECGGVLCLEVNLDPPNEASLAFHRRRGFLEVGQQHAGGHLVTLMEKRVAAP